MMKRSAKILLIIWAAVQFLLGLYLAWAAWETAISVWQWTGRAADGWLALPYILPPFLGAAFTAAFLLLSRKEQKHGRAAEMWRTLFLVFAVFCGVIAAIELLLLALFAVLLLLHIEFLPAQG